MARSFGSVTDHPWLLPGLLIAISAASSSEFACVTPFAAFAVAAGYALPVRAALLTVAAVWLANQAIGFTVLGYPWTVDTILWGIAIGAAALLAARLASATFGRGLQNKPIAVGTAFVLALAGYEGGLFLVTFVLGGREAFTPAIVGHVALLNLGWTIALVAMVEVLSRTGVIDASLAKARATA
jgi:hypothetical protein